MNTSKYIHKEHNASVLLYHLVFPAKYRKSVLLEKLDQVIKDTCLEIEKRYEVVFIEIGTGIDQFIWLICEVVVKLAIKVTLNNRVAKSVNYQENCPKTTQWTTIRTIKYNMLNKT